MNDNLNTRICRTCNEEKDIVNFPIANIKKGKEYRRHNCDKCDVKAKITRRRNLSKWLLNFKKSLVCAKCNNNDFRVLEFHHFNDDKEFNIGGAVNRGFCKDRILIEIKKCEVLCANCHRILHFNERKIYD